MFFSACPFASTPSVQHSRVVTIQEGPEPDRGANLRPRKAAAGLVLLVEDDFVLRSSLSEFLTAEGFRVDCCADGRAAFRRLHAPPKPNLILLDMMLPYLDGYELRALQRKSPLIANIPVVVISAHDLDPQSVGELGLPPPLRKPLDLDRLLATMRALTGPPNS
jgi:DNA-binding response OmpR family regulator